jgi:thiol-disulfide isomerase/thioredoxin
MAGLLAAAVLNASMATQLSPAASQESRAVVAASQSALDGAHSLSYKLTLENVGGEEPTVQAEVRIERLPKGDPLQLKFAIDATFQPSKSDQALRRIATFDGNLFRRRDDPERRVRELRVESRERRHNLSDVTGALGRQLYYSLMWPSYRSRLRGDSDLHLEPEKKFVDGERCLIVFRQSEKTSPRGSTPTTERLFLAERDHFPRRLEEVTVDEIGHVTASVWTISSLRIDEPIPHEVFAPAIPDGYVVQPIEVKRAAADLLPVGQKAPDWSLKDAQGRTGSLADLRGKVVLLDFWAEWCGPCKDLMPTIQTLHERYGPSGLVVVGIDSPGGDPAATERAAAYFAKKGYGYSLLLSGDTVAEAYKAETLPTVYVIDRNGIIAYHKHRRKGSPVSPEEASRALERDAASVIEQLLK